MIEGATVTLPLDEFDELRANSKDFQNIARQIATCFEYEMREYGEPEKCKTCKKENPVCRKCKVFKESPPWEEILTVDVERLIRAVKQYALYGKDIEADAEEATVIIKRRGASK